MLYSVELGSQYRVLLLGRRCGGDGSSLLLLDPGFLAGQASEVEDPRAADFTYLVQFDRINERRLERENTLHADSVGHLADGEGLGDAGTAFLDHDATELLDTLLVFAFRGILLDLVGDGDGVTGLELREIFLFLCQRVAGNFHQIHSSL